MKRLQKKIRNQYAIDAHFRSDAGPMEKLGKMKNKALRKKAKQNLKEIEYYGAEEEWD